MKNLLIIFLLLTLFSCGTNKYLTSSVQATEVENMNYFKPLSYIQYIKKGNKLERNDSLSNITQNKIDSILIKNKSQYRLSDKITIDNDTINAKIESEINYLAQIINRTKNLNDIKLTPTIDSIIQNNDQRFSLIIVAAGFRRRKGNYGGQVAKGAAIGILTLGMAVPTPIKSNLFLHGFIFDSKNHNVAFYKRVLPQEKSPTDPEIIKKQLNSLFEGYFYERK
ncbi:hypothetical protein [Zunongwangia sp.]|uniref:hypothetical protein n=1 Tax=Zunongwangia sp. TaxID=1965325 RepID=UPI003AA7D2CE